MTQAITVPSHHMLSSHGSSLKNGCVKGSAGALLFLVAMIWLPSIARPESTTPDPTERVDTFYKPAQEQAMTTDTWEKSVERLQNTMPLGVAGLPGTNVPPALNSSMKSLSVRSIAGPKVVPLPKPPVSIWRSAFEYQFASIVALALLTAGWLTYRLRHLISKQVDKGLRWFDAKAMGVSRLVLVDELDHNAVMTPAAVRQRGWTPELMAQLLGRPDFAVVDPTGLNPPLILISRLRVEALEKNGKFQAFREMQVQQARQDDLRLEKWNRLHGEFRPFALNVLEEVQ
jgi:hypothetical protein